MRLHTILRTAALAATLTLALVTPALAITFGQVDTQNRFPYVGALIGEVDGEKFLFCTGTLIEDGDGGWSNLYLTAGHCVDDGQQMWVSFDAAIDPEAPETATLLRGIAHAHPDFACCGFNDPFDIAVVVLDAEVVGITPAPVAEEGLLDSMSKAALREATFVTVGYGDARDVKTGGLNTLFFDGLRRWTEQTMMNFNSVWLNLSMQPSTGDGGTCYGDSGGPHFLNGVVVSVTVTGDIPCRATDKTYRVDTAVAQEFLSGFTAP
jgi:hypothetical protein